jgi:hypothetical protein
MIEVDGHVAIAELDTSEGLNIGPEYAGDVFQQTLRIKPADARFCNATCIHSVKLIAFDLYALATFVFGYDDTWFESNFYDLAGLFAFNRVNDSRWKEVAPDVYPTGLIAVRMNDVATFPFQVKYYIY